MDSFDLKTLQAGQIFTPGSPVNERDLFAGRIDQLRRIFEAVTQRGYHAVLYGDRGVGKTSLANILMATFGDNFVIAKVNCDANDTFSKVWHKAFRDIHFSQVQMGIGFNASQTTSEVAVSETLPLVIQPDDVRRSLKTISAEKPALIILDEFDRITDKNVSVMVSDTIKALSDFGISASVLVIGVADSIDQLISGHLSIERALVQIHMPRMSIDEISQILEKGMTRLDMQMDGSAAALLQSLSQGLPYIAHLLALHSTRAALAARSLTVTLDHANAGVVSSLEQWQESTKTAYYDAVKSQQPGAIYREVLLACAMAEVDDLGFFSAAAVRLPLSNIAGRTLDIPNFSRHLKEFSESGRGKIIKRVGAARRLRYRFASPLMRPYVIMRGYSEKLIA